VLRPLAAVRTQWRHDTTKCCIVLGSKNGSNSDRLREVAAARNIPAWLVDNAAGIDHARLEGKKRIGVTAGASAPEVLVNEVVARIRDLGAKTVRTQEGVTENVIFPIPKDLQPARD
jgi:4-hydroxy-3-methylbut-2-en-1-yl diphosphate reductase